MPVSLLRVYGPVALQRGVTGIGFRALLGLPGAVYESLPYVRQRRMERRGVYLVLVVRSRARTALVQALLFRWARHRNGRDR